MCDVVRLELTVTNWLIKRNTHGDRWIYAMKVELQLSIYIKPGVQQLYHDKSLTTIAISMACRGSDHLPNFNSNWA